MVNPTGYTALDLIGFTDKGTYSSSENYVKNDLVHYSGNIWRCLVDDTSGVEPAEGVNWTLFIGEPTNLVERIIAPVETDPATSAWTVGRQIIFNDNLYEVIVAITAGDALVAYEDDPTNANIKLADPVESQVLAQKTQIQTLTSKLQAKKYNNLAEVFTLGNVTAVSGDTRSSMLDKLYADAASRLAAMSSDSFITGTIELVISNGTRATTPISLLTKTSTFPEVNFIDSSIDVSTSAVIHEVWNMKSSGSKQSSTVVRSDGTTLYPNDSFSVNAGVTYSLFAQRYIANDAVLS